MSTKPTGTGTAPLLYWLAVIGGLASLTVLRFDKPNELVAIWFGAVVGVSFGQILALLRLRAWVPIVTSFGSAFFLGALLYMALDAIFGTSTEVVLITLLPAALGGYLSMSERASLLAFWFPAMVWVVVILDGPSDTDARAALPFAVCLGALFVAFMRATASRRVELWRNLSLTRLAKPAPRTVLRASPLRALVHTAWTAGVGGAALVLAVWVAPQLWKKEAALHSKTGSMTQAILPQDTESGLPCCPEQSADAERIKELLPLHHEHESVDPRLLSCVTCAANAPAVSDWRYEGTPGAGLSGTVAIDDSYASPETPSYSGGYASGGGWSPSTTPSYDVGYGGYDSTPAPAAAAPPPPPPVTKKTPKQEPPPPAAEKTPEPPVPAPPPPEMKPAPNVPIRVAQTPAPPVETGSSIPSLLLLGVLGVLVHLGARALRRRVTVRHLVRPFWKEPLDQRVSNHWQRMLIGLRDAGIRPGSHEQPQAFARRVGIEGMTVCATILERVRHGVRIEAPDLAAMETSATLVYRTARARAGAANRLAGAFRWPL